MIKEFVEPGHLYSVIPNITNDHNNNVANFLNLDFNHESHNKILNELNDYLLCFDETFGPYYDSNISKTVQERQENLMYSLMNDNFEWMDGRLLYYFLQKNKPKRIIEIGSGNSTLLSYNTKMMFHLDLEIVCIESNPTNYLRELHRLNKIKLFEDKLENIDLELFKTLDKNDILFIDSSHVLKIGSDVMYYFNKIFPLLNKGVFVQIHDIFFPYDYPMDWLKAGRFWNEQYFLYVFLQYNTKFKIYFCNSYAGFKHNEKLKEIQEDYYEHVNNIISKDSVFSGGSIWLIVESQVESQVEVVESVAESVLEESPV